MSLIVDSPYIMELVVQTFCPFLASTDHGTYVLEESTHINQYLEFYKQAKEDFLRIAKPVLETLVKPKNLDRLVCYLRTVNDKNNFENTIWFGILPNVLPEKIKPKALNRIRFPGSGERTGRKQHTMEDLSVLFHMIYPYRISLFFSFRGERGLTFPDVAEQGIDRLCWLDTPFKSMHRVRPMNWRQVIPL